MDVLSHILDDSLSITRTLIIQFLTILEDLQGGISLDLFLFTQALSLGAVHVGQVDALLLEHFGSLLVLWLQFLAMSTPYSIEVLGRIKWMGWIGYREQRTRQGRHYCP